MRTVVYGAFGYALTFALFGYADQGWMMYAILVFSAVFWVSQPALQSLISDKTPPQEQGELQGTLVSLYHSHSVDYHAVDYDKTFCGIHFEQRGSLHSQRTLLFRGFGVPGFLGDYFEEKTSFRIFLHNHEPCCQ